MIKKKVKALLMEFSKKNVFFRKIFRKILYIKRFLVFKLRTIRCKTDSKLILFFAYKGQSYACTPKAIYNYLLKDKKYKDFKFIWAFKEPEKYKWLEKNRNTKVIKYGGKEYEKNIARAKYWVVNYRVDDHIWPKKEQIYIQCWHGTPLKKLGYDLINTHNALNSQKEIRDKYRIDAEKFKYIVSPSRFASEKFISAWNLKEIGKENAIIEKGYPRNDILYNYKKSDIDKLKEKFKIEKNKKIILYTPTWRDDEHTSGVGYTYKLGVNFDKLKKEIGNEYVVLFRAHYLVSNSFDFEKYKDFVIDVSKVDDINELYLITDLLITDYSSVFFDFANLKKPIIFYMYDLEKYKGELRGFYINLDELPGKIAKNEEELIDEIHKIKEFEYDEKYEQFNKKFNYLDDGQASKRVVEECIKWEI